MRFQVQHGNIKLKVVVLPTVEAVHKQYHDGINKRDGSLVLSFFEAGTGKITGTIYLTENTRLYEIVPHEVCHAVMHHLKMVHTDEDEKFCTAVGLLTAQILNRLEED